MVISEQNKSIKTDQPMLRYLGVFALICLVYIIGNLPAALLYALLPGTSSDLVLALGEAYGHSLSFVLLMLPWVLVCLSFFPITKLLLGWSFTFGITNRSKVDWNRILFGFGVWFVISIGSFLLTKNEHVLYNFNFEKFIPLVFVASIILLLQCAAEELVFRSLLYRIGLQFLGNAWLSVIFTGVVFGLLHGSNPEVQALGSIAFVFYIGTGIFLGLLRAIDNGLELSIGFHFANNFFAALIVTSNWQVFQTDALFLDTNPPSFDWTDFILLFGGQLAFFVICWYRYKWNFQTINSTKF